MIRYLNDNQGFNLLGDAKGTKEQQFQTLWGRVYGWNIAVPAKIQHDIAHRAYNAWYETWKDKKTKLRTAKYFDGRYITIQTCPTGYNKGKLYPKFWKDLGEFTLRYNHRTVSIIGNNCLTISVKYGRLYLSQPNTESIEVQKTKRVLAIDPGIRSFATMFDGNVAFQITNATDLTRLAKIQAYHAKLDKKSKTVVDWFHKKKILYKMSRLKLKLQNLVKDLHVKLATWITKNYDLVYIPNYRVKQIYRKGRQNKTNRKNQLNWSWYKFVEELTYRCTRNGSVVVIVSEAYTSKTCSKCGAVHGELGSKKLYVCPKCGHTVDRDLNGAVNILHNSLVNQGGLG